MEEAMKAVQKVDIGINQAAREYGVPRTTLKDQVSGRVKHGGTKSGPQPYLSVDEETEQFQLQTTLTDSAETPCKIKHGNFFAIIFSHQQGLTCTALPLLSASVGNGLSFA